MLWPSLFHFQLTAAWKGKALHGFNDLTLRIYYLNKNISHNGLVILKPMGKKWAKSPGQKQANLATSWDIRSFFHAGNEQKYRQSMALQSLVAWTNCPLENVQIWEAPKRVAQFYDLITSLHLLSTLMVGKHDILLPPLIFEIVLRFQPEWVKIGWNT